MEKGYVIRILHNMAITKSRLNIVEEDGLPSTFPYKLKVTNGTLTDNGDGTTSLSVGSGSGASTALNNLASVAINTSLISDTDSTDDLGSSSKYWANGYVDRIYLNSTAYLSGAVAGKVGINTASPGATLDIVGNFLFRDAETPTKGVRYRFGGATDVEGSGADLYFSVWDNGDFTGTQRQKLQLACGADTAYGIKTWHWIPWAGGSVNHTINGSGGVVFNENGAAYDTRIEGDTDVNLLFVDASADNVGIGTATPGSKLTVSGTMEVTGAVKLSSSPTDGARLTSDASGNATWTQKSVRIIYPILPSSTTSTTYDDGGYHRVVFDKSAYTNIKAIYFQSTLQNTASGTYDIYSQLVDDGGTAVTDSELTASLSQWGTSIQISGDIQAGIASGPTVYRVKNKVSSGGNGGSITNALIVEVYV